MKKYQVCIDIDFDIEDRHFHETNVYFETDSEYEAQCYIGEMYALGDYSNYYIREVNK